MESNAALLRECRATFAWWERFASSRAGTALMFAWALAEALVWPFIPDALLVPMAAGNRRRFHVPLLAAIAGSALGGMLLFLFAFAFPGEATHYLNALPLVSDGQIAAAQQQLGERGAAGFVVQPWSGVPFKVWGLVAGIDGMTPWQVIPTFVAARAARMAVFATLGRLLAGRFTGFVRDNSLFLWLIYLVLFFYGWWQLVG